MQAFIAPFAEIYMALNNQQNKTLSPPSIVILGTKASKLTCYHPISLTPHEVSLIRFGREMIHRNPIAVTGDPVIAYTYQFGMQLRDHVRHLFLLPFAAPFLIIKRREFSVIVQNTYSFSSKPLILYAGAFRLPDLYCIISIALLLSTIF